MQYCIAIVGKQAYMHLFNSKQKPKYMLKIKHNFDNVNTSKTCQKNMINISYTAL